MFWLLASGFSLLVVVVAVFAPARHRAVASVTLDYFDAVWINDLETVVVTWKTATELNTLGFIVQRSAAPDGPYVAITTEMIPAVGDQLTGWAYDPVADDPLNLTMGVTYWYQLVVINNNAANDYIPPKPVLAGTEATATPTFTLTPTPTTTPTRTATPTPTSVLSATPGPSPTPSATRTPVATFTPGPSPTPSTTRTPTATFTPGPSPTPSITPTPTATFTPGPSLTPSITPTPTATFTPGPSPTPPEQSRRTPTPTATFTPGPSPGPSPTPTPMGAQGSTITPTASPRPTTAATATSAHPIATLTFGSTVTPNTATPPEQSRRTATPVGQTTPTPIRVNTAAPSTFAPTGQPTAATTVAMAPLVVATVGVPDALRAAPTGNPNLSAFVLIGAASLLLLGGLYTILRQAQR